MFFPSFDNLIFWIIWLISSLPNITENVRNHLVSLKNLKTAFTSNYEGFESFACFRLFSNDSNDRNVSSEFSDTANFSVRSSNDNQWWDEWLRQSGNSGKKKQKLTSSLVANSSHKMASQSPFKTAGFANAKRHPSRTESLSVGKAIQGLVLNSTKWFNSKAVLISHSVGKFASPWLRFAEFEVVESRTYAEFYLHNERVKLNRHLWQQRVGKVAAFAFHAIPFSEEVEKAIRWSVGLKSHRIKVLKPLFSFFQNITDMPNGWSD